MTVSGLHEKLDRQRQPFVERKVEWLMFKEGEYSMKRKIASLLLAGCMAFSMCACGGKEASSDADNRVYAVEAGSAGEAAAKEKGFEYNSVSSQADSSLSLVMMP